MSNNRPVNWAATHVADMLGQLDSVRMQPLPHGLVEAERRRNLDHLPPKTPSSQGEKQATIAIALSTAKLITVMSDMHNDYKWPCACN